MFPRSFRGVAEGLGGVRRSAALGTLRGEHIPLRLVRALRTPHRGDAQDNALTPRMKSDRRNNAEKGEELIALSFCISLL